MKLQKQQRKYYKHIYNKHYNYKHCNSYCRLPSPSFESCKLRIPLVKRNRNQDLRWSWCWFLEQGVFLITFQTYNIQRLWLYWSLRLYWFVVEEEVVRPYTPVTSLAGLNVPPAGCVRLIVKNYTAGRLSSWLCSQPLSSQVWLSLPHGNFSPQPLTAAPISDLILLAAGTGLTPMVSLITWALRSTR